MIRAVSFDFDSVLTTQRSGTHTTVRALARSTGLAEAAIRTAITPHMVELVLGRRTHAQAWPAICTALGAWIDPVHLTEAFASTPLNPPMLALARALAAHCRVGMITDNPANRMTQIASPHGLHRLFDPLVASAEVGSSMRSTDIFRAALAMSGEDAPHTFFIDNTQANLDLARHVGMHVFHYDDSAHDVARLRATLTHSYGLPTGDPPAVY